MWKPVVRNYSFQNHFMNIDNYFEKTDNLDNYLEEIIGISTNDKNSTWGRIYIQIPIKILYRFGVLSNLPIVSYHNNIGGINKNYYYCYYGEIFSGDAAWFEEYKEIDMDEIKNSQSYKNIKQALENINPNTSFLDFFDKSKDKWNLVPIQNIELAELADKLNNHLK